jgi:flagellin
MVINTNLSSLTAQRHLASSRADMETAMERLSSGKRINSAGDDAAGLSISHSMNAQVTSMNQATRNANDGIAMINLAEGAMDQVTDMLTRMKELATQAANGTYSEVDRSNLNAEYTALKSEIDRIASVTSYNGVSVLGAGATSVNFQVGENSTDNVSVQFQNIGINATNSIGQVGTPGASDTVVYSAATKLQTDLDNTAGFTDTGDNNFVATDTVIDSTGSTGTPGIEHRIVDDATVATKYAALVAKEQLWMSFTINGETKEVQILGGTGSAQTDTALAGLKAAFNGNGFTIDLSPINVNHDADGGTTPGQAENFNSVITVTSPDDNAKYEIGALNLIVRDTASTPTTMHTSTIAETSSGSADGAANAVAAIANIDKAITDVDSYRSDLGAVANRLEHTVGNLMTRAQHTSAAMSRIMDADYATESANLAKAQVLQQAGTAMLAQANASTQNVLSLLK